MKKIKCPCCNKEMEMSEISLQNSTLYDAKCRKCHIAVTTDTSPKNLDWLLFCFYRGQWDFEMKYINGEVIYARVGGGHRLPITSIDRGMCYECPCKTETCQEGLHCPREVE